MRKFWRTFGLSLLIIILVSLVGFTTWASNPAEAEANAVDVSINSQLVAAQTNQDWLVFKAQDQGASVGLILYPGARVDYRAYAPHAEGIAQAGFTVVVVPMPLNFAFFGVNQVEDVMAAFPEVQTWALGGHSLGGAMAAEFTASNSELLSGLVLWAAYPAGNTNLSAYEGSVLSVFASNDGLATLDEINGSEERLPEATIFVEIEDGNHAGFGWYGAQNGDGVAEISQEAQQALIVAATVSFLKGLQE